MDARVTVPDLFVTPIGRPARLQIQGRRRIRIAERMLDLSSLIGDWIQNRHHVGAFFGRTVDQAIGIHSRIPFIG